MPVKMPSNDSIVSYCTKCKEGMDHIVVTREASAIGKVKCRNCGSTHKYRDPSVAPKPRVSRKKTVPTTAMLWNACLQKARGKELLYTIAARYRVGDIVLHDKFGKGVVRKLDANKCHVIFEDKERLMASAN